MTIVAVSSKFPEKVELICNLFVSHLILTQLFFAMKVAVGYFNPLAKSCNQQGWDKIINEEKNCNLNNHKCLYIW